MCCVLQKDTNSQSVFNDIQEHRRIKTSGYLSGRHHKIMMANQPVDLNDHPIQRET